MICGALQTLNEEACEDVLEETEEVEADTDVPITFIVPPSPESQQGDLHSNRTNLESSVASKAKEFAPPSGCNSSGESTKRYGNIEPPTVIVHSPPSSKKGGDVVVTICADAKEESHF